MTTTLFDRTRKSGQAEAIGSGADPALFNSDGIAEVTSASEFLARFGGLEVVGVPNLKVSLDVAGSATTTYTVPSGKSWRLLSMILEVVTDATVANRTVTVATPGDTIVLAAQAASTTVRSQIVFSDNTQGNLRVEPVGTLTIAEPVTAADSFTLNTTTFTFVAALTGAANEIFIGANEAATKAALDAAFADRDNGGVLHSVSDAVYESLDMTAVAFAGDDMVFTYSGSGSATVDGEAIVFLEVTLTHASNVLDGSGTLGGTTAGVGAGTKEGTTAFPGAGVILDAAETVVITEPVEAAAGDDIDIYLTYIEYDVPIK